MVVKSTEEKKKHRRGRSAVKLRHETGQSRKEKKKNQRKAESLYKVPTGNDTGDE